jgi:hypothetical protein
MPPLPSWFRQALTILVIAMPLLLVGYAVVMVGSTLLQSLGDNQGALLLRWIGSVLVMLFGLDAISLLFMLGWERISSSEE